MTRRISEKHIALDEPTREFLSSLRVLREHSGMSVSYAANCLGIRRSALYVYENGRHKPNLNTLMKLAELFEYDLSGSINYKFYHGKLCASEIKDKLTMYGLTYSELSKLTGYDAERISDAVNLREHGSILCLWAVIEEIKREEHMWQIRRKILRKVSNRKVTLRR